MVAQHLLRLAGKQPLRQPSIGFILNDNASDNLSQRESVAPRKMSFKDKIKNVVGKIRKNSINSAIQVDTPGSTGVGDRPQFKSPFAKLRKVAGFVLGQRRDSKKTALSLISVPIRGQSSNRHSLLADKVAHTPSKFQPKFPAFRWSVDPEGNFKMFWESMKFILLIWTFFYLPVKVAFIPDDDNVLLYTIDKLIDVVFLVDIILNFFTPVYLNYELVYSRKVIARTYLAGWFVLDLIAVLPIEEVYNLVVEEQNTVDGLVVLAKASKLIRLLRLLKLIRLFKTFDFTNTDNYFIKVVTAKFKGTIFYLLLPNVILMVFTMHILTCIWFFVATQTEGIEDWIWKNGFQDRDALYLYVASFYLVVQSYTSCGYGDIPAFRAWEMMFKICTIIIGSVMYGIYTGRIIDYRNCKAIEQEMYEQRSNKFEQIRQVFGLNEGLTQWVKDSLKNTLNKTTDTDQTKLDFSSLSKEDVQELKYRKATAKFAGHPLFSKRPVHREWILELQDHMQKAEYPEGEIIYKAGEVPTHLYILKSGMVGIGMTNVECVPVYLHKTGFFGENEILNNTMRLDTIMAVTDCIVYKIGVQEFRRLFVSDEELHQDIIKFSKYRRKQIDEAQDEFKFILRRKMFWRLSLPRTKNRKTKSMKNIIDLACKGNQEAFLRKTSTIG